MFIRDQGINQPHHYWIKNLERIVNAVKSFSIILLIFSEQTIYAV